MTAPRQRPRPGVSSLSPDATEAHGVTLGRRLQPGDLVLLSGDLAAGKTTFVRGLVHGLGGEAGDVDSPTFVLLQTYPCGGRGVVRFHHVDLYRLDGSINDLREIGIEEVLSDSRAVTAVEWPKDVLSTWIPPGTRVWRIMLTVEADGARRIEIVPPL